MVARLYSVLPAGGKIVAAGSDVKVQHRRSEFGLVRYQPDGSFDRSFGTKGLVTTAIGPLEDYAYALALQPDRKIVVGGSSRSAVTAPNYTRVALARYDTDGSLDPGFGAGGTVVDPTDHYRRVLALALQPDGKIVVAAQVSRTATEFAGALLRYTPDGSLDASFGRAGAVSIPEFMPGAIVLQPDGKILVAAGGFSTYELLYGRFALARYNPDGSPDAGFGTGGIVTTAIGQFARIGSAALQPDGKIVAAGSSSEGSFTLARYNPDGSLDSSFGVGGIVTTDFGAHRGETVAVQPDRKTVVAGAVAADASGHKYSALARYNPDGSLDASFGTDGKVLAPLFCLVLKVKGKKLGAARRTIHKGRCSVGNVSKAFSRKVRRVVSQKPRAGTHRVVGAKVSLVVSKGRH